MDFDHYWRVAPDQYTCVSPPGYEKDPAVTAAIREFDPGLIPVWRVQLWRFPGSATERRVVHHGIARYYPVPRYMRRALRVELPADFDGDAPNMLDAILEDDNTLQYKRGGPGDFLPWDWSLYRWCRFQFDKLTLAAWSDRAERKQARQAREYKAMMDELEYRKKQVEPYLLKTADKISDRGVRQYMDAMWGSGAGKVPFRESKLFADLGRSPRPEKTFGRVAPALELGE